MPEPVMVEVCICGQPTRHLGDDSISVCDDHGVVEGHTREVPEEEVYG